MQLMLIIKLLNLMLVLRKLLANFLINADIIMTTIKTFVLIVNQCCMINPEIINDVLLH